jgi:hypothetical protein
VLLAGAAVVAAAGCDLPAKPRRPELLTVADLEAMVTASGPDATFAEGRGVPGGLRVADFITKDTDGTYHLALRDTWTETYRSAYETAEIWTGFREVWAQPVYVAITGFDGMGQPMLLPDPDTKKAGWSPIFSVGPDSAFYSPFWQTIYFKVPDTTDPDAFKSTRQVLDSGAPLIPGPAHTMSIVPAAPMLVPPQAGDDADQKVGGPPKVVQGYLDGGDVSYLDFGKSNFIWDDHLVIAETPLFMLVYRDDAGLHKLNVPTVAGTGPLYANHNANVDPQDMIPHYGAFWRLYVVEVPPTALIFAPQSFFMTESAGYAQPRIATEYGASVTAAGANGVREFLGRVAVNAVASANASGMSCFGDFDNLDANGTGGPEHCQWLDTQEHVEQRVPPQSITKTDILITCPFVSYHDQAVVVTP